MKSSTAKSTALFLAAVTVSAALSSPLIFAQSRTTITFDPNVTPYQVAPLGPSNQKPQKPSLPNGHYHASTLDENGHWTSLGPGPVQVDGSTGSPISGRVSSIAVSETKHGTTVYAGTASGGVWSSSNDGKHWTPLTDDQASLVTGSVAVDPSNPNILYVGTGEQHFSADSRYGQGILKSTDGGKSWTLLGSDVFDDMHIGKIAVDPFNSSNVWVAADNGLWQSTDGGQTWDQWYSGEYDMWPFGHLEYPTDVYLDAHSQGVMYMSVKGGGLYKSTDGGQDFEEIGDGPDGTRLPNYINDVTAPGYHMFSASLAVVEGKTSAQDTLYTSYSDTNGELIGMYVSKDGGDTWTQMDHVPQYLDLNFSYTGTFNPNDAVGQGPYDNVIAVDPTNPNHILAGGVTLIESRNGGKNWTVLDTFEDKLNTPIANIHPSQHAITFDSKGNAFIGNDGGIYEETSSGEWHNLNTDLNTLQFNAGISVINNGHTILAGTQSGGTLLLNEGSKWNQVYGGSGGFTYMDPLNPQVMYAESQYGNIVRRTDSTKDGNRWFASYPGYVNSQGENTAPFVTPFIVRLKPTARSASYEVFVGAGCVERSTDGGNTYDAISPDFTSWSFADPVVALSQSQSDPNVVYAGTTYGQVYVSFNAESDDPNWTRITPFSDDFSLSPDPTASVSAIAIKPDNAKEITVTFGNRGYDGPITQNHVYWTSDTSASTPAWTNVSANLPATFAQSATYVGNAVVVGTEQGVYMANPGTTDWRNLASGLPNAPVTSLVDAGNGTLVAGTYGRGAFQLKLGDDVRKLTDGK